MLLTRLGILFINAKNLAFTSQNRRARAKNWGWTQLSMIPKKFGAFASQAPKTLFVPLFRLIFWEIFCASPQTFFSNFLCTVLLYFFKKKKPPFCSRRSAPRALAHPNQCREKRFCCKFWSGRRKETLMMMWHGQSEHFCVRSVRPEGKGGKEADCSFISCELKCACRLEDARARAAATGAVLR